MTLAKLELKSLRTVSNLGKALKLVSILISQQNWIFSYEGEDGHYADDDVAIDPDGATEVNEDVEDITFPEAHRSIRALRWQLETSLRSQQY